MSDGEDARVGRLGVGEGPVWWEDKGLRIWTALVRHNVRVI